MNKKILFLLVSLVVIIIGGLVFFVLRKTPTTQTNTIEVQGRMGGTIPVKDFKRSSVQNDQAAWTLQDNRDSAVIMYNENSDIFTILVHANEESEFNEKRQIAEQQFLDQLGISKEEACKLKAEISTDGPETDLLPFSQPQSLSFCQ